MKVTKDYQVKFYRSLEDGEFECLVEVFNAVDRTGDRLMPPALDASLEEWRASGEHIPLVADGRVIGSINPYMIRRVDPTPLAPRGGLMLTGRLDDPEQSLVEIGIEIDTVKEKIAPDAAHNIWRADVIQFGIPSMRWTQSSGVRQREKV